MFTGQMSNVLRIPTRNACHFPRNFTPHCIKSKSILTVKRFAWPTSESWHLPVEFNQIPGKKFKRRKTDDEFFRNKFTEPSPAAAAVKCLLVIASHNICAVRSFSMSFSRFGDVSDRFFILFPRIIPGNGHAGGETGMKKNEVRHYINKR